MEVFHYSQVHLSKPKIQEIFKKAYNEAVAKAARKHTGGDLMRMAHVRNKLQINGSLYVNIKLLAQEKTWDRYLRYIYKDDEAACPDASDDGDE